MKTMAQIFLNKEKTKYTTDALKGKMECEIIINESVDDGKAIVYKITDLRINSVSYTVKHITDKKIETKTKYYTESAARSAVDALKTEDILVSIDDCIDGTIYLNRVCGEYTLSVIGFNDEIVFRRAYKTLNGAQKRMKEFQYQ